mgnify:CR=1 FL=1
MFSLNLNPFQFLSEIHNVVDKVINPFLIDAWFFISLLNS